jgi:hypothetical protein
MNPLRAQMIQAYIANLQVRVALRQAAEKQRHARLELDPGELDLFRQRTTVENKRLVQRSPAP